MCGKPSAYLSAGFAAHLGQHRSTQRKMPIGLPDEARLTEDIIALTEEFGREAALRLITVCRHGRAVGASGEAQKGANGSADLRAERELKSRRAFLESVGAGP